MVLHGARSRDKVTIGEEYVTVMGSLLFSFPLNEISTLKKRFTHNLKESFPDSRGVN